MNRLLLLIGLAWRTRLRGFTSSGASSVLLIVGALVYLAMTCAMGAGAYFVFSRMRGMSVDRMADFAALIVTIFGVFFLTRPLILSHLAGRSLQNLLHLPIRRSELLLYSLITGVVTPLILESPVLIGAALGAAEHPALALLTFPLALVCHLTLLAGAHAMSLVSVLIARRTWIADGARVLAFSIFFLPSLLTMRGSRELLRPILVPLVEVSPLGWAARAAVHAGSGNARHAFLLIIPSILLLLAICWLSMTLLNRILAGEGVDRVEESTKAPRRARVLLPGSLGALVETQIRSHLRTPAARMALLMPTLMMGLFALSLSRQGQQPGSAVVMVLLLSALGGTSFVMVGRGIALILGTPVSRAAILVASDISSFLFRVPPLLAILAVTAWRSGPEAGVFLAAVGLPLMLIGMGVQHFVAILRPFALPRDRFNPFAQRVDSRQTGNGLVSVAASVASVLIAAPFLFLAWLSGQMGGALAPVLLGLAGLGALAAYSILVALAERLLVKRELDVLEVLLDDSPA